MGVLSLLQMRDEVTSSMGTRPNILPARFNTWINLAYTDIASGVNFAELDGVDVLATVAAQHNYAIPVNPLIIEMVRDDTNENLLTWIPNDEYFRLDRSTPTGEPKRWTRRGAEILLWPDPAAIYSLSRYYKATPAVLAADGDFTVLPGYVDNGIILLATGYGLLAVNEDQRAVIWVNRAVNYLSSRLTQQDFSFLLGGLAKTQPNPTQGVTSGT